MQSITEYLSNYFFDSNEVIDIFNESRVVLKDSKAKDCKLVDNNRREVPFSFDYKEIISNEQELFNYVNRNHDEDIDDCVYVFAWHDNTGKFPVYKLEGDKYVYDINWGAELNDVLFDCGDAKHECTYNQAMTYLSNKELIIIVK